MADHRRRQRDPRRDFTAGSTSTNEAMLLPLVTSAWHRGWQPRDLDELARRHLDRLEGGYLIDLVAAESQGYAAATIDHRWQAQLDAIGARPWWAPQRSHDLQWCERHGHPAAQLDRVAASVAGMLTTLPTLPVLLPLPGTPQVGTPQVGTPKVGAPQARRAGEVPTRDEKTLARVRALLAKAESSDYPSEAEALSAKAQELMSRYSIDRVLVETAHDASAAQPGATARRLWLDAPYVGPKAALVNAIATANRCRAISTEKIGFITVLGDETDLSTVELLVTSLLVQASRAMMAEGSQMTWYGQSRTRSFRRSFLFSYATRIGQRLTRAREATETAISSEESARLVPALAEREARTDALVDELFPRLVQQTASVSNQAGWAAGRRAADLAVLDAREQVGR